MTCFAMKMSSKPSKKLHKKKVKANQMETISSETKTPQQPSKQQSKALIQRYKATKLLDKERYS